MKNLTILLAIVVLATGCASTRVLNNNPMAVQQPWEAYAIPLDVFNTGGMSIVALDVPSLWLGDGLGVYDLKDEKGRNLRQIPAVRKTWTAVVFIGGIPRFFPAVINRFGTRLFVLCPQRANQLIGRDILILSGSRKFCLTEREAILSFDGEGVVMSPEKRWEFFQKYPSQIPASAVREVSFSSTEGRQFLKELVGQFPKTVVVEGRQIAINCDPAVFGETNNANAADRIAGSLSVNISPATIIFPPIELARILVNVAVAASDKTLHGSFFEAKVTGMQAAMAMGQYNEQLRTGGKQ